MRSSTGATHDGATASIARRGCSFMRRENNGCAINASPIQFGAITNARRIRVSFRCRKNAPHASARSVLVLAGKRPHACARRQDKWLRAQQAAWEGGGGPAGERGSVAVEPLR